MERNKMPRAERAKQFAPFDALKGLHERLRLKEFEHERVAKGEVSEEKAKEMTAQLLQIENGDNVEIEYYNDGYYVKKRGVVKINYEERFLQFEKFKIAFDELFSLKKL